MVDLEVVPIADAAEDRPQDRLVDVLYTLAARAHQVMVMLGNARDVRRDVTGSLEPRRHARLDLRLEGAIDSGQAETWIGTVEPLVQLLR